MTVPSYSVREIWPSTNILSTTFCTASSESQTVAVIAHNSFIVQGPSLSILARMSFSATPPGVDLNGFVNLHDDLCLYCGKCVELVEFTIWCPV